MTDDDAKIATLRGAGRMRKSETGDTGAAAFAMVKIARENNIPDRLLQQAVDDLREEGVLD